MKPAASEQDLVTCPEHIGPVGRLVPLGKPDVFINGRSAIRLGDMAICSVGGPDAIGQGAATVRLRDDLGLTRRNGPEMPTPESVRGAVDGPMDLRPGGY